MILFISVLFNNFNADSLLFKYKLIIDTD